MYYPDGGISFRCCSGGHGSPEAPTVRVWSGGAAGGGTFRRRKAQVRMSAAEPHVSLCVFLHSMDHRVSISSVPVAGKRIRRIAAFNALIPW